MPSIFLFSGTLFQWLLACALATTAGHSLAQGVLELDPDWKELQFAPPATIAKDKLMAIAMPPHLTLNFAVDTSSINVGADRVVRYVVWPAASLPAMPCTKAFAARLRNTKPMPAWAAMVNGIWCKTRSGNCLQTMAQDTRGPWHTREFVMEQHPKTQLLKLSRHSKICRATIRKVESGPCEHQVVSVQHFRLGAVTQQGFNFGRGFTTNNAGFCAGIISQAACKLLA